MGCSGLFVPTGIHVEVIAHPPPLGTLQILRQRGAQLVRNRVVFQDRPELFLQGARARNVCELGLTSTGAVVVALDFLAGRFGLDAFRFPVGVHAQLALLSA